MPETTDQGPTASDDDWLADRGDWLADWGVERPLVIGMLHLPPLAGAPRFQGRAEDAVEKALRDADRLATGGVDGLLLENFGDAPFYPHRVPAHVATQMTAVACAVRHRFDLPLGINVLRNDALTALAVAQAVGGAFVRVNVLCGVRLTDQGLIQGAAHELLRSRRQLDAQHVRILADVAVKHSAPLAERPLIDEAEETLGRGLADGLIVSGTSTGRAPPTDQIAMIKQVCRDARNSGGSRTSGGSPVFVGSGVDADNVEAFAQHADGLIVGSAFERDGRAGGPVELERVRAVMSRLGR